MLEAEGEAEGVGEAADEEGDRLEEIERGVRMTCHLEISTQHYASPKDSMMPRLDDGSMRLCRGL
jgi:hypothetical protein